MKNYWSHGNGGLPRFLSYLLCQRLSIYKILWTFYQKIMTLLSLVVILCVLNLVRVLWTLPWSTDQCDSRIKTNIVDLEKKWFLSFRKSIPMREGFRLESPLTFYFLLFLKWEKLSKNKNPLMTPVRKKWFAKLDFWVWESGYLSGRYLIWGSTPLGSESDLYWWIGYIGAYGSKINQFLPRAT